MIITLTTADFSAENLGVVSVAKELSPFSKKVMTNMTRFSADSPEAFAFDAFHQHLVTAGIWDKITKIHVPSLAATVEQSLYDIKKNDGTFNGKITPECGLILDKNNGLTLAVGAFSDEKRGLVNLDENFYTKEYTSIAFYGNEINGNFLAERAVTQYQTAILNGFESNPTQIIQKATENSSDGFKTYYGNPYQDNGIYAVTAKTSTITFFHNNEKKEQAVESPSVSSGKYFMYFPRANSFQESQHLQQPSLNIHIMFIHPITEPEFKIVAKEVELLMEALGLPVNKHYQLP